MFVLSTTLWTREPEIKLFSNTSAEKCICQMKTHRLAAHSRKQTGFYCQRALKINTPAAKTLRARTRLTSYTRTRHYVYSQVQTHSCRNIFFAWKQGARRILTRPMVSGSVRNKEPVAPAPLPWRRNLRSRKRASERTQPVGPPRCAGCIHRHNWRKPNSKWGARV